jgi:hypothetical protein
MTKHFNPGRGNAVYRQSIDNLYQNKTKHLSYAETFPSIAFKYFRDRKYGFVYDNRKGHFGQTPIAKLVVNKWGAYNLFVGAECITKNKTLKDVLELIHNAVVNGVPIRGKVR